MDEDFDDGFFSIDQLLFEEGYAANTETVNSDAWVHEIVRKEGGDLNDAQRRFIVFQLIGMKSGNKLPWGTQTKLAKEVGVHRSTISRIFNQAEKQIQRGDSIDVSSKKPGNSGRKPMDSNEEWLQSAPLHLRTTYRAYAGALKCSHMHVFRLLKRGKLRVHTSNNHPHVSDKHKIARMKWVLSHIVPATHTTKATFVDMKNVIHIDEKWFYLNADMRRFYLLPAEMEPYRSCQSRRYKVKAMFMGVTSRPLYNDNGDMIHDGKFGIYPFVYKQRAKKSSKNRLAGTVETKAIQNVNHNVIREMLISKVIPTIMAKWPASMPKDIYIQQDNARPHLKPTDPEFVQAATENGFNIQLICQPPQLPDLNVLDLGLFRAIQSLQYHSFPKNLGDLIQKVEEAYEGFDPNLINFTWLQLQYVMVEILKVKGGNNYRNPHHGKARLQRMGQLPENVEVDQQIIDDAVAYLNERLAEDGTYMDDFEDGMEVDAD